MLNTAPGKKRDPSHPFFLRLLMFMQRILKCCQGLDSVQLDGMKVAAPSFPNEVVILALSDPHLEQSSAGMQSGQ